LIAPTAASLDVFNARAGPIEDTPQGQGGGDDQKLTVKSVVHMVPRSA